MYQSISNLEKFTTTRKDKNYTTRPQRSRLLSDSSPTPANLANLEVLGPIVSSSANNVDLQRRICILGAGPGGLSLAHFLQRSGYTNIHVYEKAPTVGGKATGVWCESRQQYVGSGQYTINNAYSEIRALSEEFEVDLFGDKCKLCHFDMETKTFSNSIEHTIATLFRLLFSTSTSNAISKAMQSIYDKCPYKISFREILSEYSMITYRKRLSGYLTTIPTRSIFGDKDSCSSQAYWKTVLGTVAYCLPPFHDILRICTKSLPECGFADLPDEVFETADEFLERQSASRMAKSLVKHLWNLTAPAGYLGCGFSVPAVFKLKLSQIGPFGWHLVKPDGYLSLCKAMEQKINATEGSAVYTGRPIQSIRRKSGGGVGITSSGTEIHYDDLVITGHLNDVVPLMIDASSEEIQLAQEIATSDYVVTLAVIAGLPGDRSTFLYNTTHCEPESTGHVFLVTRTQYDDSYDAPGSNLYSIFQYGTNYDTGEKISDEKLLENIKSDLKAMGGSIHSIEGKHHWDYFPHPRVSGLKRDFFRRLESLQGLRNTFYAGSTLNFELTETTVQYSKQLVQKQFLSRLQNNFQIKAVQLNSRQEIASISLSDAADTACSLCSEETNEEVDVEKLLYGNVETYSSYPKARVPTKMTSLAAIAALVCIVAARSIRK
jgi:phytoene dehydrogenase-like protein